MRASWLILMLLVAGCASGPQRDTLADLRDRQPDLDEVVVEDSLDKALAGYREYLARVPDSARTPEALRRVADLQVEKAYGILGDGDGPSAAAATEAAAEPVSAAPPQRVLVDAKASKALRAPQRLEEESSNGDGDGDGDGAAARAEAAVAVDLSESEQAFEQRTTGAAELPFAVAGDDARALTPAASGPAEAIATYEKILQEYPNYERNDQVLYQMARAYDEMGEPDRAMEYMEQLIQRFGGSDYGDEVLFRRGEYFFVRRRYLDAEDSYADVVAMGPGSAFYELALYKLGWSFYKQELYEEALHRYVALLDYKRDQGYDFERVASAAVVDAPDEQGEAAEEVAAPSAAEAGNVDDERRVADTFRVISLAFSNLGGPETLNEYFSANGNRPYEDRIYSNLGEFYLDKLRYQDAATVYRSFTELNPLHKRAPHFGMRVVDISDQGGFGQLVVKAKRDFARRYGVKADYWAHYDINAAPEVLGYLKANLKDLANHYHALYRVKEDNDDRPAQFAEAETWYREFLSSFPQDGEAPDINYQLADLLFENLDYEVAAQEYERTAYGYAVHDRAAEAGYAAVFTHREHLKTLADDAPGAALRATVESSLRFADTFPGHEQAPPILLAAAEDLYRMEDLDRAIAAGRTLVERYVDADVALRRSAWSVIAHGSFDLTAFTDAEQAYAEVLALTDEADERHQAAVDDYAAAIYQQGEAARAAEDFVAAADHYLRVASLAPMAALRPAAEYDAANALMRIEDWAGAAEVLRGFRTSHPGHELQTEVTKQLAYVYQQSGDLARSAEEYQQVADDSDDPELRREALLVSAQLFEDAGHARALEAYQRYVDEFPEPLETALELRFKIAGMHETAGRLDRYHEELERIVDLDAAGGAARTPRTRYLAARSALVLTEPLYDEFEALELTQPFEDSLAEKQRRMDRTLAAFEALVDYGVAEVTAAATYYMAEVYDNFGRALLASERPADLDAAERLEYDMALEAEAFPFEEQAIVVHEKNRELLLTGTFNPWIRRSLSRLATLMPGRYAKAEVSTGYLGPEEVFAYRTPAAQFPPSVPEEAAEPEVTRSEDATQGGNDVTAVF